MPKWARSEGVLLHEIAHFLNVGLGRAPHGPEYCAFWLDLTERAMGQEAATELWRLFDKHGVRY